MSTEARKHYSAIIKALADLTNQHVCEGDLIARDPVLVRVLWIRNAADGLIRAALAAAPAGGAEPVATAIVQRATGSTMHTRLVTHAGWRDLPDGETKLYVAPTLLNGLTEQETAASASVAGLSGAQPERYVSALDPALRGEVPAEPSDEPERDEFYRVFNESAKLTGHQPTLYDVWLMARGRMDTSHRALAPVAQQPAELTDAQIETLRKATFSTDNPFCPVDAKSMRKAARAVERFLKAQGGSQ